MGSRTSVTVAVILSVFATARAQGEIGADVYLDKVHGMWMGQILGNYAGRGQVPGTSHNREGYIVRGGADFDIGWNDILSTATWVSDDDTMLEFMALDLLKGQPAPTSADIRQTWVGGRASARRSSS